MMYVRKRYCRCCGGVLAHKRTERIVRKGDPDHFSYCTVGTSYKPHGDILVIGTEYYCPTCQLAFSCDKQGEVMEAQKYYQRNVVSEDELAKVREDQMYRALSNLLSARWLLLLPVIGSVICSFMIFNTQLSQRTRKKDGPKLIVASMMMFGAVTTVATLILGIFSNVGFMEAYGFDIALILALLSVNIPTLWYINHTFK